MKQLKEPDNYLQMRCNNAIKLIKKAKNTSDVVSALSIVDEAIALLNDISKKLYQKRANHKTKIFNEFHINEFEDWIKTIDTPNLHKDSLIETTKEMLLRFGFVSKDVLYQMFYLGYPSSTSMHLRSYIYALNYFEAFVNQKHPELLKKQKNIECLKEGEF